METVKLEEIMRQKDPLLKQVVEQLARGQVSGLSYVGSVAGVVIRSLGMRQGRDEHEKR